MLTSAFEDGLRVFLKSLSLPSYGLEKAHAQILSFNLRIAVSPVPMTAQENCQSINITV